MNNIDQITGLVVSYNTKELLKRSIESLRVFYPDLPILIIDSSDENNECCHYVRELSRFDDTITSIYVPGNIGHGKGMDKGIRNIRTKYVLLFDSDIEIISPCLEEMIYIFSRITYGVGQVITVDRNGSNCVDGIAYLHPHFCIIQIDRYFSFPPFIHHGAPLLKTMLHISERGYENELKNFDLRKYVIHKGRGTRDLNPPEFLNNWE